MKISLNKKATISIGLSDKYMLLPFINLCFAVNTIYVATSFIAVSSLHPSIKLFMI